MGSLDLEEEILVQMVHDFMESESSPPIFPASSNCLCNINHQANTFTLQDILGRVTEAESEVLESVLKHIRCQREEEKTINLKLLVMKLKTDGFNASICQNSWVTSLGCPAGDYECIDVIIRDKKKGDKKRLIVDTDFRSQFELARPTKSYKQLTDTLPTVFVGSEEELSKIISLLCSAAKQSLKERGLHVPPWRTIPYMQSKWLSGCPKVTANYDYGYNNSSENREAKSGGFGLWAPPPLMVKPKRRGLGGGGSALSSQFSNMGINCC